MAFKNEPKTSLYILPASALFSFRLATIAFVAETYARDPLFSIMHARILTFIVLVLSSTVLVVAQDGDMASDTLPALPTATDSAGDNMLTECMKNCFQDALLKGQCTS